MVELFIKDYIRNYKNYKERWNYEDGCILKGCLDLYEATHDEEYMNFIYRYMDNFIEPNGNIKNYDIEEYNIDNINSGKVLFFLYEITKDEKIKKAIELLYSQLKTHPRTKSGNFWHKKIYSNQIWLDGLYMAMPFYTKYEKYFNNSSNFHDIVNQFLNVRRYLFDEEKKLYYHGHDETRQEKWADIEKGTSKNFWLRAMGWFLMALVDVLEETIEYKTFNKIKDLFKEAINGVLIYQDDTGMWYQVIDKKTLKGNYLETSGSLMISYAILKGVRLGILPYDYKEFGEKAFQGTINQKLVKINGKYELDGICEVAGLGGNPYRDGSFTYYISEKIVKNDPKGVGALLMAYSEIIKFQNILK